MVVMEKGKIVRSRVDEVRRTGRNTQGVRFAAPDTGDSIVAVARNAERAVEAELEGAVDGVPDGVSEDVSVDGADSSSAGVDAVPSSETDEQPDADGGQQ